MPRSAAGYANFDNGTIRVAEGDTVTGAVRFQVPDGVAVSEVQRSALSGVRCDGRVGRAQLTRQHESGS